MDEQGMKVAKILGNEVDEVTEYLVTKALNKKRVIKLPTYRKAFRNLFRKRKAH